MAYSVFRFILIVAVLFQVGSALQVTPNSPCSSYCVDSSGLDYSDPNSSTTTNEDIACYDKDFTSSPAGLKFQRCMSCLQDSTYSQGHESDQAWFLYNLRYTFDYCIFGFPNATNVASTPCSTSTACGGLEIALTSDDLDATNLEAYGYCSADNGAMGDTLVSKCKACVSASDGQDYLTNFIAALEVGCQQQPAAGTAIGLNETVFSTNAITAVDPSRTAAASATNQGMPITTVVGIVVGVAVVLLVVAGILFVRCRRRRNRRVRLGGASVVEAPKRSRHRPVSSLSFRCQAHLSPRSPVFLSSPSEPAIHEEKQFTASQTTVGAAAYPSDSPISTYSSWNTRSGFKSERGTRNNLPSLPLHHITTAAPTIPSGVHHSTSPRSRNFSPIDDMTTPASTTSTKSTTHLLPLKPYNPAEYGVSLPQMGSVPETPYISPTSASTASPLISRAWDQKKPLWETPLPVKVPGRQGINVINVLGGNTGKRARTSTGSPVETKEVNVKFPGPPSPKRF